MPNVILAKNFIHSSGILTTLVGVIQRKIVYNIWDELVDHTPVCSGKAAYSWFVSPNIPITKDRLPNPIRPNSGEECERFYEDPRQEGRYFGGPKKYFPEYKRNFGLWHINNPVNYIDSLNRGNSLKAPIGFVQMAIDKGLNKSK